MSLYGRTDSNADVAKAGIGIAASSQAKTIVFVDDTEAALSENKLRGINAPGWWSYYTFTDCDGNTRHKCEHLVTLANPEANADETQSDDTIAADVASAITISVQPANATAFTPAGSITNYTVGTGTTLVGQANQVYTLTGLSGSGSGTGLHLLLLEVRVEALAALLLMLSALGLLLLKQLLFWDQLLVALM